MFVHKSNCKNKLPCYYVCTQIHKTELKKHSEEPDVVVYVNIQVLIKLSRSERLITSVICHMYHQLIIPPTV